MHPEFTQVTLHDRQRELDRRARTAYLHRGLPDPIDKPVDPVVLRLCSVCDDEALDRLAALEGRPTPLGRHVLAEIDGVVVAARSLISGDVLADPFRPTAHLLPLLALRASQVAPASGRARSVPFLGAARRAQA
jgi:hypothetical protein